MNHTAPLRKVALFVPSLRGGGAERVMVTLAKGFVESGLVVDLVLAKATGPYLAELPSDVRVTDLQASRVLTSLPGLVRYLRQEGPDAMLSTLSHANVIALWAKRLSGVPVRVVVREANVVVRSAQNARTVRGKMMPWLISRFYKWADAVVAVSKEVAADLRRLGIAEEKIRVIYNPTVTPDLFEKAEESVNHPWFASGGPPVVLGVGRLTTQKDFDTLIRAFAMVQEERPARLVILGEGVERPHLEALVKELGVSAQVELPGFMDNPYKYMKRAAVFVLSSRWEGLPNALIQALALGVPVVSTDCPGGPAEILEGGEGGVLVPVGNVEALANAIINVLSRRSECSREVMSGSLCGRFYVDAVVQSYLEVMVGKG